MWHNLLRELSAQFSVIFTLAQKCTPSNRGEKDQHQGKEQWHACEQEGELREYGKKPSLTQQGGGILLEDQQVLSFKDHRLFCAVVFVPGGLNPANKSRCVPATESGHKKRHFIQQKEHAICWLEGADFKQPRQPPPTILWTFQWDHRPNTDL